MPDILLIQPPIRDFYLTTKRTIPYGLMCIASVLLRQGFSVEVLDCLATSRSRTIQLPQEMSYLRDYYGKDDTSPFALFHHFRHFGCTFEDVGEAALRSGAFLVGISSLFSAYSDEAMRAAQAVRESHPACRVVLGGHHPTEMPERAMECRAVDFVIRGEGEVSMVELAGRLKQGVSVESVPGIVYRMPGGTIKIGEPAVMEALDDYPLPAMHLMDHRFYRRGKKGAAVVVASRGCPFRCSYCSVGASSYAGYRQRSVESVLREIDEAVVRYDAGFIDFEDENISLSRGWFMELLAGIKERFGSNGLELRAMNGLFPPSLDEEVLYAMKEAGFRTLNLSLGTFSQDQLKSFSRPDTTAAFDRALHYAEQLGLKAVGYIVVGAPGQNPLDSVSDLLHLARRPVLAGVSVYYPSPGSEYFRRCEAEKILPERLSLMRSTALPLSDTTSREDSATLLRLGRILNFMKSLPDRGKGFPESGEPVEPYSGGKQDRIETGKFLLRQFFYDGVIRGMTHEGEVFAHKTSRALSRMFIDGIVRLGLIR